MITYMVQIVCGEADPCLANVQEKLLALQVALKEGGVEHTYTEARDRLTNTPFGRRPHT